MILTNYAHLNQGSFNLADMVRPADLGAWLLSHRSYYQWWSMGAAFIVDGPEIIPILSGANIPTSEGWKAELA